MRGWLILVVGVSGCGFSVSGGHGGDGGAIIDARPGSDGAPDDGAADDDASGSDAPPADANPAATCVGNYRVVCAVIETQPLNVNTTLTIDTTAGSGSTLCQSPMAGSTVGDACVIARPSISLNATLRASGPRPLVLLAQQDVTINTGGAIDVSSKSETDRGAGGRLNCAPTTAPAGTTGGGAGGTYGDAGGIGGVGGDGVGGIPTSAVLFANLVGGCNGGDGAYAQLNDRGRGGAGGGAVLVVSAAGAININGDINASGGRGSGGNNHAGGGGGGAGGAIVLDGALTLNGSARVWAQGASGAEGGGNTAAGNNGNNPTNPGTAAAGGEGASSGGPGGDGGVDAQGSNGGGGGTAGGGGGGGGVGFIRYTAALPSLSSGAKVHPVPVRLN